MIKSGQQQRVDGVRAFTQQQQKDVVETARKNHNMSPIATIALGRLLTGGL